MTQQDQQYEDFFAGIGEGGAPGFHFDKIDAGVVGIVVDQHETTVSEPKTNKVKTYPDGTPIPQLNVTLQTELRNWAGIKPGSKSLLDDDGKPRPASEDDGLRRVFVKYQMRQAVAKAVKSQKERGLRTGGKLGIKMSGAKDVGKANDLPQYEAVYTAPSPSDSFISSAPDDDGQPPF